MTVKENYLSDAAPFVALSKKIVSDCLKIKGKFEKIK